MPSERMGSFTPESYSGKSRSGQKGYRIMRSTAFSWQPARAVLLLTVAVVAGCDRSSQGFALPEGDAEQGRAEFVSLGCGDCHSIMGDAELGELDPEAEIRVILGGPTSRVQTYGNLVTSIINPSHHVRRGDREMMTNPDGSSRMRSYNDIMTVQQLVDLVTLLKEHYEVWTPPTSYPPL